MFHVTHPNRHSLGYRYELPPNFWEEHEKDGTPKITGNSTWAPQHAETLYYNTLQHLTATHCNTEITGVPTWLGVPLRGVRARMHTHTRTHTDVHTHTCVHMHTHIRIPMHIYVRTFTRSYTFPTHTCTLQFFHILYILLGGFSPRVQAGGGRKGGGEAGGGGLCRNGSFNVLNRVSVSYRFRPKFQAPHEKPGRMAYMPQGRLLESNSLKLRPIFDQLSSLILDIRFVEFGSWSRPYQLEAWVPSWMAQTPRDYMW